MPPDPLLPLESLKYCFDIERAGRRLILGYAEIDEVLVWGLIDSHLPRLLTAVRALLALSPSR